MPLAATACRKREWWDSLTIARRSAEKRCGTALGVVGAMVLFRLVDSLLFEVAPTDPAALAVAIALMLAVTALACAAPARRAARIDPAAALRGE